MKRDFIIAFLLSCFFLLPAHAQSTSTSTLEIRFTGLRSDKGLIAIGYSTSSEGWPREPQKSRNWKKANQVVNGVFTARLENLPRGTYAISVLDDVNGNNEMEMTLGIPKEGWGFSMNPPFKLSAPKFDECSFRLDQPFQQITIDLRYAGKGAGK